MAAHEERWFARSSPVGAYWLRNCEGFEVREGRRRRLGVVSEVRAHSPLGHAHALVVRKRRRERTLGVERVLIVDPEQKLLLARRRPSATRHRAAASANLAARGARSGGSALGRAAVASGRFAWPALRRTAARLAAELRRHAPAVRVVLLHTAAAGVALCREAERLVRRSRASGI